MFSLFTLNLVNFFFTGSRNPDSTSPSSACGGHLTGPFFEIKWPDLSSTGDYGQTVQCVYTVHRLGSDTCTLRVTFVTFDLGDGRDCPRQFVQIGEHTLCGRLPSYTVRKSFRYVNYQYEPICFSYM